MATIVGSAGGGAWNQNATWVGGVQPTAADDVTLSATSGAINIPTATTAVCRSLDCSGFLSSLTFDSTTAVLSIGDASGGLCKFVNTMTLPLTGVGTINFLATTASTIYALTTAGLVMPNLTINTGTTTTIQLADAVTATGAVVTLTQGTLDTNGKTCVWGNFITSGSLTRAMTLGASNITVSASVVTPWGVSSTTGFTFTAGTSTITSTYAFPNNAFGTLTYNNFVMSGMGAGGPSGTLNVSSTTFANLTISNTNAKSSVTINGNCTITNTFTITGNSATSRILFQSNIVGTARTITAAAVSMSNLDLMDITGAGAASWNLSAITGLSGNCGGNSGITFTTPATQTHTTSAGGNWSDVTKWTSRVPLPQDNVIVDSNTTGTITADMPRIGANLTFTGFVGTFSNSTANSLFGNLVLGSGMTLSGTSGITAGGRSTHTLTTNAVDITFPLNINAPGGSYSLQDNWTGTAANTRITPNDGTFDANGFNVNISDVVNNSARTRTLNMGTGTWTLYNTGAVTIWNTTATGLTLNASTSTIIISGASASTRSFFGAAKTYGTLTYTVAGSTGELNITGSNTFATINFSDVTNARALKFTAGTTTTINTAFNVSGTSGKLMTISSITASTHTIAMPTGISRDYLSISFSTLTGNSAYAGANSVDGGNNSTAPGWIFTASPNSARTLSALGVG